MHLIFRTKEFLKYMLSADNEHAIHSPFVYDLYTNIILDRSSYYAFEKIESVRAKMILSDEKIPVLDYGTGGEEKSQRLLKISYIARHYVKPQKDGQLLFRLINYFHPGSILEMGTSLGITTLFLAAPVSKSKVVTIEGCPNTSAVARKNFERAGVKNIVLETGEFNKSLPLALAHFEKLDFVYFDGNHRKQATLQYFNQCLELHHTGSVFVFDDIHWSSEMLEAWDEIRNHPLVTISIDLYRVGIIFFRETQPKQHFRLRF